jgi:hypothetical protein
VLTQAEELIALIYGSIVNEVVATCENMTEANHRLEKMFLPSHSEDTASAPK